MQKFESPDSFTVRAPVGDDAWRWDSFIIREQARTYAGMVPEDFAQRALERASADSEGRRRAFDEPGTTVRLIAESAGELVGAVEVSDGPADWEVSLGFGEVPAARELSRLYLARDAHGSGLASSLMAQALGDADAYLWLIDGIERAQRFYRRHGFVDHGPSVSTGPSWGGIPMHRMARLSA